jgi:hypothetical protein
MALPATPSALRGISQYRSPIFDPRTGSFIAPGFVGGGLSTTGNQPAVVPSTGGGGTPAASPSTIGTPLGNQIPAGGGGAAAGLRGIAAERSVGGGGPGTDRAAPAPPSERVNLDNGLGDALDLAGTALPGTLGMMATIGEAGIAANNAQYSKDQLQAAGYGQGLPGSAIAGAALGQVTPGGIIGNDLGVGDANSALAAASRAEKAVSDGRDTYHDPAGYKTSPSGPISRNPTFATRTAPMPGQAAPAATAAPPANAIGTPAPAKPAPGLLGVVAPERTLGRSWPGYDTDALDRLVREVNDGSSVEATTRGIVGIANNAVQVGRDAIAANSASGGGGQGSGGGGSGAGVGRGGQGSRDSSGSYN